jgi:catechol 2,3-dioxygenase-like lactoylglutathione lyase family enzyme
MIDIKGIDNVLVPVGDLDEAVEFYAGKLGLPVVFRLDGPGIVLFRLGAEPPGLLVRRDEHAGTATGPAPRLWLEVADARRVAETLAETPFAVATGWTVEVSDPWGNIIGFTDYTTMPERGRAR